MKYFLDTEFVENGFTQPLEILSIGIICEDGRELYLERETPWNFDINDWVKQNVLPHMSMRGQRYSRLEMAEEIVKFIPPLHLAQSRATYDEPELWGYFADYDWVLFCQLFGTMMDLPKGYPMYCMDLMQYARHLGIPRKAFPKQEGIEHNALEDARWNLKLYQFLRSQAAAPESPGR